MLATIPLKYMLCFVLPQKATSIHSRISQIKIGHFCKCGCEVWDSEEGRVSNIDQKCVISRKEAIILLLGDNNKLTVSR